MGIIPMLRDQPVNLKTTVRLDFREMMLFSNMEPAMSRGRHRRGSGRPVTAKTARGNKEILRLIAELRPPPSIAA
jgi:hypothetical protein